MSADTASETWRARLTPDRRFHTLLVAAMIAVAAWTMLSTCYVAWIAYSPMPWGDHWSHWQSYLAEPGLTLRFLFSPHNEHRIVTARLLFWIDHHIFAGRQAFLAVVAVAIQILQAVLLWCMGRRLPRGAGTSAAMAAASVTAALSAEQFTNFTWAFQVSFLMVFVFANAAIHALGLAGEVWSRPGAGRTAWAWLAVSVTCGWLASYSISNGLIVWPVLCLFGAWLGVPRAAFGVLVAAGLATWATYLPGLPATGTVVDGFYQFPRALVYALTVLGLPIDIPASALMQVAGLPAPPFPGLGGDSVATLTWRPVVAMAFATLGLGFAFRQLRDALSSARVHPWRLALLHCVLFLVGTVVLIGLGRSPRFDVSAVMQSRYSTPALLFWACLSLLYLGRRDEEGTGASRPSAGEVQRLQVVVGIAVLTVAITQSSLIGYARGYTAYLSEAEEALESNVYDPEVWARLNTSPTTMVPIVTYFRLHHLSVFARPDVPWAGQRIDEAFRVVEGCLGSVDTAARLADAAQPGVRVRGWAWDAGSGSTDDGVVIAGADGRILTAALAQQSRGDVIKALPQVTTERVGWTAYVSGLPSDRLQAFLIDRGRGTACRVGDTLLPPPAAVNVP